MPRRYCTGGENLLLTLALWHEGFSDREIKSVIGHSPTSERRRLGLPPNSKCVTCNAAIRPRQWLCYEHKKNKAQKDARFFVAQRVLANLSKSIGDEYYRARDLALSEWPWLGDTLERWEADGRIGPVPKPKSRRWGTV